MEALYATSPLVLVLRGGIMGAAASVSAPGPLPLQKALAQIYSDRADVRVEIVRPTVFPLHVSVGQRVLHVDGYSLVIRRRSGGTEASHQLFRASQLILDLP